MTEKHLKHDPAICESRLVWVCPVCGTTVSYECGDKRPLCPRAIRQDALPIYMDLKLKGDANA